MHPRQGFVEVHSDKPVLVIEFRRYVGVLKLIVTISADQDKILGMVSSQGIKMMNLEIWLVVPLEEPEVACLAMPLVEPSKQSSQTRWSILPVSACLSHG
jgi:hypothetical protein